MKKKNTHTHTPAGWGIKLRMPWLGPSNGTTEHRHQTGKRKRKKAKYIHQHRYQTENRISDNFKTDADCYRNKTGRTGWVFLTPLEETLNH